MKSNKQQTLITQYFPAGIHRSIYLLIPLWGIDKREIFNKNVTKYLLKSCVEEYVTACWDKGQSKYRMPARCAKQWFGRGSRGIHR